MPAGAGAGRRRWPAEGQRARRRPPGARSRWTARPAGRRAGGRLRTALLRPWLPAPPPPAAHPSVSRSTGIIETGWVSKVCCGLMRESEAAPRHLRAGY